MTDVTVLLAAIQAGDSHAATRLLAETYAELRRIAAAQLAHEAPHRTLDATALVHEAYLKLVGGEGRLSFESRRHFFGAAARAMRQVRIDAARSRGRQKRGATARRVELLDIAGSDDDRRLADLDDALAGLAQLDALAAEIVDLHHFAGLSLIRTAEVIGVSEYQVRQKWDFSRAWLQAALS